MKVHNNHNKHSLNVMKNGQDDKKIIRLYDREVNKINIIGEGSEKCLIIETDDGNL